MKYSFRSMICSHNNLIIDPVIVSSSMISLVARYGTDLQVDDNGEDTSIGSIKCKSKSPGATSYRPSFLHSKWGR